MSRSGKSVWSRLPSFRVRRRVATWAGPACVLALLSGAQSASAQAIETRTGFVKSITIDVQPDGSWFWSSLRFELEDESGSRRAPCSFNGTEVTFGILHPFTDISLLQQFLLGAFLGRAEIVVRSYATSVTSGCLVEDAEFAHD